MDSNLISVTDSIQRLSIPQGTLIGTEPNSTEAHGFFHRRKSQGVPSHNNVLNLLRRQKMRGIQSQSQQAKVLKNLMTKIPNVGEVEVKSLNSLEKEIAQMPDQDIDKNKNIIVRLDQFAAINGMNQGQFQLGSSILETKQGGKDLEFSGSDQNIIKLSNYLKSDNTQQNIKIVRNQNLTSTDLSQQSLLPSNTMINVLQNQKQDSKIINICKMYDQTLDKQQMDQNSKIKASYLISSRRSYLNQGNKMNSLNMMPTLTNRSNKNQKEDLSLRNSDSYNITARSFKNADASKASQQVPKQNNAQKRQKSKLLLQKENDKKRSKQPSPMNLARKSMKTADDKKRRKKCISFTRKNSELGPEDQAEEFVYPLDRSKQFLTKPLLDRRTPMSFQNRHLNQRSRTNFAQNASKSTNKLHQSQVVPPERKLVGCLTQQNCMNEQDKAEPSDYWSRQLPPYQQMSNSRVNSKDIYTMKSRKYMQYQGSQSTVDKSVEKQRNQRSESIKKMENRTTKNSRERPLDNYLSKIEKESKNLGEPLNTTQAHSQNPQIQSSGSNQAMLKPIPIQMFQMQVQNDKMEHASHQRALVIYGSNNRLSTPFLQQNADALKGGHKRQHSITYPKKSQHKSSQHEQVNQGTSFGGMNRMSEYSQINFGNQRDNSIDLDINRKSTVYDAAEQVDNQDHFYKHNRASLEFNHKIDYNKTNYYKSSVDLGKTKNVIYTKMDHRYHARQKNKPPRTSLAQDLILSDQQLEEYNLVNLNLPQRFQIGHSFDINDSGTNAFSANQQPQSKMATLTEQTQKTLQNHRESQYKSNQNDTNSIITPASSTKNQPFQSRCPTGNANRLNLSDTNQDLNKAVQAFSEHGNMMESSQNNQNSNQTNLQNPLSMSSKVRHTSDISKSKSQADNRIWRNLNNDMSPQLDPNDSSVPLNSIQNLIVFNEIKSREHQRDTTGSMSRNQNLSKSYQLLKQTKDYQVLEGTNKADKGNLYDQKKFLSQKSRDLDHQAVKVANILSEQKLSELKDTNQPSNAQNDHSSNTGNIGNSQIFEPRLQAFPESHHFSIFEQTDHKNSPPIKKSTDTSPIIKNLKDSEAQDNETDLKDQVCINKSAESKSNTEIFSPKSVNQASKTEVNSPISDNRRSFRLKGVVKIIRNTSKSTESANKSARITKKEDENNYNDILNNKERMQKQTQNLVSHMQSSRLSEFLKQIDQQESQRFGTSSLGPQALIKDRGQIPVFSNTKLIINQSKSPRIIDEKRLFEREKHQKQLRYYKEIQDYKAKQQFEQHVEQQMSQLCSINRSQETFNDFWLLKDKQTSKNDQVKEKFLKQMKKNQKTRNYDQEAQGTWPRGLKPKCRSIDVQNKNDDENQFEQNMIVKSKQICHLSYRKIEKPTSVDNELLSDNKRKSSIYRKLDDIHQQLNQKNKQSNAQINNQQANQHRQVVYIDSPKKSKVISHINKQSEYLDQYQQDKYIQQNNTSTEPTICLNELNNSESQLRIDGQELDIKQTNPNRELHKMNIKCKRRSESIKDSYNSTQLEQNANLKCKGKHQYSRNRSKIGDDPKQKMKMESKVQSDKPGKREGNNKTPHFTSPRWEVLKHGRTTSFQYGRQYEGSINDDKRIRQDLSFDRQSKTNYIQKNRQLNKSQNDGKVNSRHNRNESFDSRNENAEVKQKQQIKQIEMFLSRIQKLKSLKMSNGLISNESLVNRYSYQKIQRKSNQDKPIPKSNFNSRIFKLLMQEESINKMNEELKKSQDFVKQIEQKFEQKKAVTSERKLEQTNTSKSAVSKIDRKTLSGQFLNLHHNTRNHQMSSTQSNFIDENCESNELSNPSVTVMTPMQADILIQKELHALRQNTEMNFENDYNF